MNENNPTSTEVEEILNILITLSKYGGRDWKNDRDEATQAITRLIQQAELRGRLEGGIYELNNMRVDQPNLLKRTVDRMNELQAQLKGGAE